MNPLSNVKSLNKLNERELQLGTVGKAGSWHKQYRSSAWIFFGGVSYELTEGDIICIFSQYGEVVNVNLIRDKKTGKSKGYGFLCYEDQRSTDLAVDNFNGTKILERIIRVDHVLNYRPPKENEDEADIITSFLQSKGCAPEVIQEKLKELNQSNKIQIKPEKIHGVEKNDIDRTAQRSRSNDSKRTTKKSDEPVKIKREPSFDNTTHKKHKKKDTKKRSRSSSRDRKRSSDHHSHKTHRHKKRSN